MTLRELQKKAHVQSRKSGFYDGPPRNFPEMLALLHSEISEALEEYRKGDGHLHYYDHQRAMECPNGYMTPKPEGIGPELADAVIRILDNCEHLGLDLQDLVLEKMAYNALRPHKHGKIC